MGASGAELVTMEVSAPNPPRERKFQVVPVPGVFKRGRWRCWDFPDSNPPSELKDSRLLNFDNKEKEKEKQGGEDEPMPEAGDAYATTETTTMSFNVTVNEGNMPEKSESSTILVTSIRPAPATPQHKAGEEGESEVYTPTTSTMPREISSMMMVTVSPASTLITAAAPVNITPEPASNQAQPSPNVNPPVMNINGGNAHQIQPPTSLPMPSQPATISNPQMIVTTPVGNVNVSAPSNAHVPPSTPSIPIPNSTFEILSQVNLPASTSCSAEEYNSMQHGTVNTAQSPGTQSAVPAQSSQSQDFIVLPLSQPSQPSNETPAEEESVTTINVVAIDNKIEQAMDLVKTHLTFAVREEVEVLRNTIVELEAKVASLESQNAFFKQFVPQDILANLPHLIQQQKAQQAAIAPPPAPSSSAPPTLMPLQMPPLKPLTQNVQVPPEFKTCPATVNFEDTLNNVVAEVRNAVSGGYQRSSLSTPPKSLDRPPETD